MTKNRKLFCEYNPLFYWISSIKETMKKDMFDLIKGNKFAKSRTFENYDYIWKGHASIILRKLENVDMKLQMNKAKNLELASKKIDGIIIKPNEVFSFWDLVGKATKKKGYTDGLVIKKTGLNSGIGGGLCQLANLIHYMVLHTPLDVVELHHHSDALFPDSDRRIPFGTGTSICYKSVDYRFKNNTLYPVQLRIWQDSTFLYGEIRSTVELNNKYKLIEENHYYQKEADVFYRNSEVYRTTKDKNSNVEKKELILKNHSKVLFDYNLIPENQIVIN